MKIEIDNLSGNEIATLLGEHLESMFEITPAESVHALGIDELRAPDVTVWSAWDETELLGCGALKELDQNHGEIKSMKTSSLHLRKGVGANILQHIIEQARMRSYSRLSLETGSTEGFTAAIKLYEKFGFQQCGPFADYQEDPHSYFMTLQL